MMLAALLREHDVVMATTADEVQRELGHADIVISTAFFPLTADLLGRAYRLRLVQVAGVGVDHIDLEAARRADLTVADVAGANATSVAEHVVMATLALLRGLIASDRALHTGAWPLLEWMAHAHDLAGRTVGIVGMGRIGREVAVRLLPFGVGLLYYDIRRLAPDEERTLGVAYADLDDLLASSDLITLHVPLVPETRGLLDAGRIGRIKPGAYVINTARAEAVDEAALAEALQSGRLAGAALDVFPSEPPPTAYPLRGLPNVILTPHGAGVTLESQERIARAAVENVLRWLDGRPLADVVLEGSRP
jgi:formate dehydrogenase